MVHVRKKQIPKQNVQTEISPFPTPAKSRRRRCRTYPNMPRCQKAEKAPTGAHRRTPAHAKQAALGSLFRDCVFYENECSRTQFIFPKLGEPCNTQYIVVACPFLYIIQLISSFFKGIFAVLSFLYRRNDDLHNIFQLNLCTIFLISLVLELL